VNARWRPRRQDGHERRLEVAQPDPELRTDLGRLAEGAIVATGVLRIRCVVRVGVMAELHVDQPLDLAMRRQRHPEECEHDGQEPTPSDQRGAGIAAEAVGFKQIFGCGWDATARHHGMGCRMGAAILPRPSARLCIRRSNQWVRIPAWKRARRESEPLVSRSRRLRQVVNAGSWRVRLHSTDPISVSRRKVAFPGITPAKGHVRRRLPEFHLRRSVKSADANACGL